MTFMSGTVINLIIIRLLAGALGGNAIGWGLKKIDLGPIGNSIAGAIGGAGAGVPLQLLGLAGTAGTVDIGSIIGQAVGGGVSGAILTAIVGFIKKTVVG